MYATINPGRHRRQKARVEHYLTKGRQEREAHDRAVANQEDRRLHAYAERVRLIRQMKTVLGFPLLQYEDYEYLSDNYFSKRIDDNVVRNAMKYFDPSVTAEDFDKLMAVFADGFYLVESWVNKRRTMIAYFEFKGKWHERSIKDSDVFPDFADPYWFDPAQLDMTDENWKNWRPKPVTIQTTEKITPEGDGLKEDHRCWTEDMSCGISNPQPEQAPRKTLWRRIIAALTNQKP